MEYACIPALINNKMCIKCHFHWRCTLPSTNILYIFRKIYLDFYQKEIPKPNIPKFVLKWDYTNTKYCQIYRGVSDTNTNSTKYTLETPNNPKYKFFMVIWKTKCQALDAVVNLFQRNSNPDIWRSICDVVTMAAPRDVKA